MRGILADINVGKQRRAILAIWGSETWRDIWNELGLSVTSFPALGLSYNSPDNVIWRTCQREKLVLITGNRNDDGPDSLEAAVIRDGGQPDRPTRFHPGESQTRAPGSSLRRDCCRRRALGHPRRNQTASARGPTLRSVSGAWFSSASRLRPFHIHLTWGGGASLPQCAAVRPVGIAKRRLNRLRLATGDDD